MDFFEAVKSNNLPEVQRFLATHDPTMDNNFALAWASEFGHLDLLNLLLTDSRVNPAAGDNYAIVHATLNGHTKIVARLLEDPRVDPHVDRNAVFCFAVQYEHVDLVKFLLASPRIILDCDTIDYTRLIAKRNKSTEILALFRADRRFPRLMFRCVCF
jgi:hypothetical protein